MTNQMFLEREQAPRLPRFALARGWSVTEVIPTCRDNDNSFVFEGHEIAASLTMFVPRNDIQVVDEVRMLFVFKNRAGYVIFDMQY